MLKTKKIEILVIFFTVVVNLSGSITTIHHDKPEIARIPKMANIMKQPTINVTLTPTERQKRLLPYTNFYVQPQQQQQKLQEVQEILYQPPTKYTPFLESNAIPGPFLPVPKHRNYDSPNFSAIYEKLSQLKLSQNNLRRPNYYPIQPSKTIIETYTPTNIDIPSNNEYSPPPPPPQYYDIPRKPYIILQPVKTAPPPPIIIIQRKPQNKFPPPPPVNPTAIYEEKYEPLPKFEPQKIKYVTYSTTPHTPTNPLGEILKQLQATNTLPQTLTAENIDNSIKTLVKILGALRKQQKFTQQPPKIKPIVVAEEQPQPVTPNTNDLYGENEADIVTQTFPADTPDGGTPGTPGVDYPALSTIPPTSFNCKTQRYKGFFGDPDTNCQVWHYCDLNGGQASFLCPNGTIFSQVALTCDWWYNVKCASTAQLYVLNERLYKYIIPLTPKFPEDYSGPLVDKYLALKFQEMEEKMRKEKKGKGNPTSDENTNSDDDEEEDDVEKEDDNENIKQSSTEFSERKDEHPSEPK